MEIQPVTIQVQKRSGTKYLTSIVGLANDLDLEKIMAYLKKKYKCNLADIRFTKVLTKYSTEYNNSLFIQSLCQHLGMDQKDMFSYFLQLRDKYKYGEDQIYELLNIYDVGKLDVSRIYRYLSKYLGVEESDQSAKENNDNECGNYADNDVGDVMSQPSHQTP